MGYIKFQPRGATASMTFAREIESQLFVLRFEQGTTVARRNVASPCVVKDRRTFAQKRSTIELGSCPAIARKRAQGDEGRGRGTGQRSRSEQRQLPDRLKGKKGRIRQNCNGKRVDNSARTVVGPDATEDLTAIGVPRVLMNMMTLAVTVNDLNVAVLRRAVLRGQGADGRPAASPTADFVLLL